MLTVFVIKAYTLFKFVKAISVQNEVSLYK